VQAAGFLLGVGLLAWCMRTALSDANRAQLARLRDANPADVALLILLSLVSLLLNAGAFWTMLRGVRRIRWSSVLAVNCVATALAYLPFKLSLVFRAAVHHRRDAVPILTIGTWMGNVGVVMLAVIGPAILATTLRPAVDARWWAIAAGGALAAGGAIVLVARALGRPGVWTWFDRRVNGPSPSGREPRWRRLARRTHVVARAREGVLMLSRPASVGAGIACRAADIAAQSCRFLLAAGIVGTELSTGQAVAAAATYFVIGALAPTGSLGFREAGVFALLRSPSFAVVVLTVTAVEMVVQVACAIPAAFSLRRSADRTRTSADHA
jgi:hypothetical protein